MKISTKIKLPVLRIDFKFRQFWKKYVLQCVYASVAIFIVLFALSAQHVVIVASIGASAFIVFAMPNKVPAQPRNIVGGYIVGLLSGMLFAFLSDVKGFSSETFDMVLYSLAVGLSIFVMVVVDTEHPPASAIALGVAVEGYSAEVVMAVVLSAIILASIHRFCKPYLMDLT